MNIQNVTTEYKAETSCGQCGRNEVDTYVRIEITRGKQTTVTTLCTGCADILSFALGKAREARGACFTPGCLGDAGHCVAPEAR